jgi:hypothetical protein
VLLMDGRVAGDFRTTGNQMEDIREIQRNLRELET